MPESRLFTPAEHSFLEDLQRRSFQYFIDQAHPRTGLVRDRARWNPAIPPSNAPGSVAADGFALSGWVIADSRGWVTRDAALEHVRRTLRFFVKKAAHKNGFFYHFLKPDTGEREWRCEVSPIDTALLLSGAITAREYFQDPEITALVDTLYRRIDWRWFLNKGETFCIGWKPETGFSRWHWDNYSEHMVMNLLGLGSPEPGHALTPVQWHSWRRAPVGAYAGYTYLQNPPLFIHQFSQAYFDFRAARDAYADYFANSRLASLAQYEWSVALSKEFSKWGKPMWGLTASDSDHGYLPWGGPPRAKGKLAPDGTLVPCAPAGSLPFAPRRSIDALTYMKKHYGDSIWNRYGFADAFNPHNDWVSTDAIGIDIGITLVQAENARTGLIWTLFNRAPEVRRARALAGFHSTQKNLPAADTEYLRTLADTLWKNLAATPAIPTENFADAGLRLTAIAAAHALNLIDEQTALAQIRSQLSANTAPPTGISARAQYAAALITLRNLLPALANEITPRLRALTWDDIPSAAHPQPLGTPARLATFLAIATGHADADTWQTALTRDTLASEHVTYLAPGWDGGLESQFLPGLWLDERETLPGASARQLAYSQIEYARQNNLPAWGWPAAPHPSGGRAPVAAPSPALLALALESFPADTLAALRTLAPNPAAPDALPFNPKSKIQNPESESAALVALANFLNRDCIRAAFQSDALVKRARKRIPDFAKPEYGANTSVIAQGELGPIAPPRPIRAAVARTSGKSASELDWHTIEGAAYKETSGDIHPGDSPLSMRFAFAWNADALLFFGEITDPIVNNDYPPDTIFEGDVAELFISPDATPFRWGVKKYQHFGYAPDDRCWESVRREPAPAFVRRTPGGYKVAATIPWKRLGIADPRPGLVLGMTTAVRSAETNDDHDPVLKLIWSYQPAKAGGFQLGTLTLE